MWFFYKFIITWCLIYNLPRVLSHDLLFRVQFQIKPEIPKKIKTNLESKLKRLKKKAKNQKKTKTTKGFPPLTIETSPAFAKKSSIPWSGCQQQSFFFFAPPPSLHFLPFLAISFHQQLHLFSLSSQFSLVLSFSLNMYQSLHQKHLVHECVFVYHDCLEEDSSLKKKKM